MCEFFLSPVCISPTPLSPSPSPSLPLSLPLSLSLSGSGLPAEELHEALEAVLPEEVEGALGGSQVHQEQHQQHHGQQGDEHVPARSQDVVPLGLVGALLGQLQITLGLLVSGLDVCTDT